jgi:hypothetical protein
MPWSSPRCSCGGSAACSRCSSRALTIFFAWAARSAFDVFPQRALAAVRICSDAPATRALTTSSNPHPGQTSFATPSP